MARLILIGLGLLWMSLASVAGEVRPATEQEIRQLLIGCWYSQMESSDVHYSACFKESGTVETSAFLPNAMEGFGGEGIFEVAEGKLLLKTAYPGEGWVFPYSSATCDLVVNPWKAMQLVNCTGGSDEAASDVPTIFRRAR